MGAEPLAAAFTTTFGDTLKQLRLQKRLRQIEVAVEVSVDHSLISRTEVDEDPDPELCWMCQKAGRT